MKIIESDNEEDEVDTLEIINTKYNNITSRVAELTQYQTKYHQIVQVTDRASLKVGGIEKYEYAQFGTEQTIYFEDKSKTQNNIRNSKIRSSYKMSEVPKRQINSVVEKGDLNSFAHGPIESPNQNSPTVERNRTEGRDNK